MSWIEIVVPAAVACCEDVGSLLAENIAAAASGTQIRSGEVVFWVDLADSEQALAATRSFVAELQERGMSVDATAVYSQPAVPEEEWRDAWKKYFHVTRLTRRIVVVPSWESFDPQPDDVAIHLDPGQAFGTGAHATTRLVLEEMEELSPTTHAERVLDVGAGSGILSVAAAKLWPCAVVAIDIDPIAIGAIDENAGRNGVSEAIAASTTPVSDIEGVFDLVLANIQASVLRDLADDIAARVAPGGWLILAGLLRNQADGVAEDYAGRDLDIVRVRPSEHDPEWSVAVLKRS